jgi:hypothetical protein
MEDQHLGRLLRELPAERARTGFTPRLLARLDAAPPARARWQPRLAAAMAMAAVVMAIAAGTVQHERIEAQRAARVARATELLRELRAEHGQIKKELAALPDEPPVLYIGGNEEMDLVVDMGEVRNADGVRPATYRYDTF